MEGYPDIRTVNYWLDGNKKEAYPQSRTMSQHNKADGFERRLEVCAFFAEIRVRYWLTQAYARVAVIFDGEFQARIRLGKVHFFLLNSVPRYHGGKLACAYGIAMSTIPR
jgi:hypothetical protein